MKQADLSHTGDRVVVVDAGQAVERLALLLLFAALVAVALAIARFLLHALLLGLVALGGVAAVLLLGEQALLLVGGGDRTGLRGRLQQALRGLARRRIVLVVAIVLG